MAWSVVCCWLVALSFQINNIFDIDVKCPTHAVLYTRTKYILYTCSTMIWIDVRACVRGVSGVAY